MFLGDKETLCFSSNGSYIVDGEKVNSFRGRRFGKVNFKEFEVIIMFRYVYFTIKATKIVLRAIREGMRDKILLLITKMDHLSYY